MLYGSLVKPLSTRDRLRTGSAESALATGQRFFRLEKLGVTEQEVADYEREQRRKVAQECANAR